MQKCLLLVFLAVALCGAASAQQSSTTSFDPAFVHTETTGDTTTVRTTVAQASVSAAQTTVVEAEPTVKTTVAEAEPTVKTTVAEAEPTAKTTVAEAEPTAKTTAVEADPTVKTTVVEADPTVKTTVVETTLSSTTVEETTSSTTPPPTTTATPSKKLTSTKLFVPWSKHFVAGGKAEATTQYVRVSSNLPQGTSGGGLRISAQGSVFYNNLFGFVDTSQIDTVYAPFPKSGFELVTLTLSNSTIRHFRTPSKFNPIYDTEKHYDTYNRNMASQGLMHHFESEGLMDADEVDLRQRLRTYTGHPNMYTADMERVFSNLVRDVSPPLRVPERQVPVFERLVAYAQVSTACDPLLATEMLKGLRDDVLEVPESELVYANVNVILAAIFQFSNATVCREHIVEKHLMYPAFELNRYDDGSYETNLIADNGLTRVPLSGGFGPPMLFRYGF